MLPRAQVQSLVGEIRSHKPGGAAKKKSIKKKFIPKDNGMVNGNKSGEEKTGKDGNLCSHGEDTHLHSTMSKS